MTAARQCGSCTTCCKVLGIGEIDKPAGRWCAHCAPGRGCDIYAARPDECAQFACAWLLDESLGPEWKPDKSKIVLVTDASRGRVLVHVDPATPTAWKRSPYFEKIRQLMLDGLSQGRQVFIASGGRTGVLLPDGVHDLGVLADDDLIELAVVKRPAGDEYQATVRKLNRPTS